MGPISVRYACGVTDAQLAAAKKYVAYYKEGLAVPCTSYVKVNLLHDLRYVTYGINSNVSDDFLSVTESFRTNKWGMTSYTEIFFYDYFEAKERHPVYRFECCDEPDLTYYMKRSKLILLI